MLTAYSRKRMLPYTSRNVKRVALWGAKEAARYAGKRMARGALKKWVARSANRIRNKQRRRYRNKTRFGNRVLSAGSEGTKSISYIVFKRGLKSKFALVSKNQKKYDWQTSDDTLTYSARGSQGVMAVGRMHDVGIMNTLRTNLGVGETSDMFIGSASISMDIKNQTNIPMRVWLFDVRCVQDDCANPVTEWGNALADMSGTSSINNYGRKPVFAKGFQQKFRIYKKVEVYIPAGGVHRHTRVLNFNRRICKDRTEDNLGNYIGGWTTETLVVQAGGIVDDDTHASISESKLAIVMHKKYSVMSVPDNNRYVDYVRNLPALETEQVVVEDTDVVTTFAET